MKPVTIGSGEIQGFVLKFWHWHSNLEKRNTNPVNSENDKNNDVEGSKMQPERLKVSKHLDQVMMMWGDNSASKRYKRTIEDRSWKTEESPKNESGKLMVNSISERVFLITFNKTDSSSVNTSNVEITQICKGSHVCLPDLTSQNKSRECQATL